MTTTRDILLVEDNAADVRLTQEVFRQSGAPANLHVARDGEEAMQMLKKEGSHSGVPTPDLILLDLNLPRKDGRQVLAEIKQHPQLRKIPVIMLTTSKAEQDIDTCYALHVNSYVNKPVELDQFFALVKSIQQYWLETVQLPAKK